MKKGAIFDLDGTIIDTMHIHDMAWDKLFSKYGITLDAREKVEHSGEKNVAFTAHILIKRNLDILNPEQLAQEKDKIVLDILSHEAPSVFPGLLKLLYVLKKNQVKLALATSSTQETALLLAKDILSYFDTKVFSEAAKSGGFMCIAKDNNAGQDLSRADLIIREYEVENLEKVLLS